MGNNVICSTMRYILKSRSQHILCGVQHIHINLTLIHCAYNMITVLEVLTYVTMSTPLTCFKWAHAHDLPSFLPFFHIFFLYLPPSSFCPFVSSSSFHLSFIHSFIHSFVRSFVSLNFTHYKLRR